MECSIGKLITHTGCHTHRLPHTLCTKKPKIKCQAAEAQWQINVGLRFCPRACMHTQRNASNRGKQSTATGARRFVQQPLKSTCSALAYLFHITYDRKNTNTFRTMRVTGRWGRHDDHYVFLFRNVYTHIPKVWLYLKLQYLQEIFKILLLV